MTMISVCFGKQNSGTLDYSAIYSSSVEERDRAMSILGYKWEKGA